MTRYILAAALFAGIGSVASSCWNAIDPGVFADDCPIIAVGAIEEVAEAAPGGERADDTAKIRIDVVVRNELTDIALKPGDLFSVRMISKNNRLRTSTDLNYPVKTKAVWLIKLTTKGEFRIDVHPVQKQPHDLNPKFGFELRRDRLEVKVGDNRPPLFANPKGSKTTAEWVAAMKRQEELRAKQLAAHNAREKAIRELAKRFGDADQINAEVWKHYQQADIDVRRGVLNLSMHEQPLSGPRFAEVAHNVLLQEKDDNVRTHAVSQLAYCRDPGARGAEVLASALRDKSASVRMFACQSVKMRRYEQLIDQVKTLQNDPDQGVRNMAKTTLEFWAGKSK